MTGNSATYGAKNARFLRVFAKKQKKPQIDLKAIQERMEREAPGFVVNEELKPRIPREAALYNSTLQAVRVLTVVIVGGLAYFLLIMNGDVQLPSWLEY
eukprot:CAMPEP_0184479496 /NCGR_PEP_ID=MMETSP0113_2-20130426/1203_1 /TAXON_ID=91329 /ORGANISM="Norrisiella sphaerica, Strain BC52" /LENGTH=98 /DNA_ID=CAMNT_0026857595 /DNA_START=192 /DNA_END=488 /DNA_ORIENTATION=-